MAGHSKWNNIKRKKGAVDQKRGKIFTRCIHEITTAVKEGGGGDPNGNPRLRLAIDKAKASNVPNDTIDRAIKRGTGEDKGEDSQELTYEGYGPAGVAVLVEVMTDNKNRTVGEIRHAFSKSGGSLGANGCVAYLFDKKGLLAVKKDKISEDELMECSLEAGADDLSDEGEVWEITCDPKVFHVVKEAIEQKAECEMAEVQYLPKVRNLVSGDDMRKVVRLLGVLEELDDVLNVASNCDFVEGEELS